MTGVLTKWHCLEELVEGLLLLFCSIRSWWHCSGRVLSCVPSFCRSVMLDRAETLLHDHYAGKDYWDVSRRKTFFKMCLLLDCICLVTFVCPNFAGYLCTVLSVTRLLRACLFFNVDPSQHGFCQAPETHWRWLQSEAPELNRQQWPYLLQWGLDPHAGASVLGQSLQQSITHTLSVQHLMPLHRAGEMCFC